VLALAVLAAAPAAVAGPVSIGGYLDGEAVVPTERSERQQPQGILDLSLEDSPAAWLHGRVELRGRIGGPFEGGPGPGVYNFDDTFQNRSPAFDAPEAWVELRGRQAELRLGLQRFAWGKLDGVPPTDVVNPRDFHDPVVQDFEERKLGIPAAAGTYYLPDVPRLELSGLRAMLAYIPWAVPPHLALVEERWFPTSIVPPSVVHVPAAAPVFSPRVPLSIATANATPPRDVLAGGVAFRLSGTLRDSDWDLYHYTGPETAPDLAAKPIAYLVRRPAVGAPGAVRVTSFLTQQHHAMHMTGADWSTAAGPFTFRAEAAWFLGRPYLRRSSDLFSPEALAALPIGRIAGQLLRHGQAPVPVPELFPTLDSVEWGVGADALWHGFQPLVQVNQIAITEGHPTLLIHDPETRVTGLLRRRFLADRLELEARGVYLVERGGFYVFPRATYRIRDDVRLRLGYLVIGGPRLSYVGQFHDNDEVVMEARYTF
jgi:hypothetical protein